MRFDAWTLIRFLHVGSAILWVGGQLILSLIVRPVATLTLDDVDRLNLFRSLGSRFGRLANLGLIPILIASGLGLAYHRGVTFGALAVSGYGATLGIKVFLAFTSFGLAAAHGMAAVRSSSRAARVVGIAGAAVSVAVVVLAVSLVP